MPGERSPLSRLPKVDRVLAAPPLAELRVRADLKKRAVQEAIADARARVLAGEKAEIPDADGLAAQLAATIAAWLVPRPRAVINATGVILHTNLGRAPLSAEARAAMDGAGRYCELEIDLDSGARGSRLAWIRPLLRALTGAGDVHVVGNGAAALLLACTALGQPGGVILSRGQMVEIGDSFRIAEMAAAAGTPLREVGSTNRTHLRDYRRAIEDGASAILWAHRSNFRQEGFVASVALDALGDLSRETGVPLIADLGSGSLGPGIPGDEPTIQSYLGAGASIVTCSGDKLLSGPQAGLMAGDAALIARCRRHPMARALRPGKATFAALHATLARHAGDGVPALPVHGMIATTVETLRSRAAPLAAAIEDAGGVVSIESTRATIGGGSLPGDTLESVALAVRPGPGRDAGALARRLRLGEPPAVGRVQDGVLLLDLRTVDPSEDEGLARALTAALRG